jgi:hypothetical protein
MSNDSAVDLVSVRDSSTRTVTSGSARHSARIRISTSSRTSTVSTGMAQYCTQIPCTRSGAIEIGPDRGYQLATANGLRVPGTPLEFVVALFRECNARPAHALRCTIEHLVPLLSGQVTPSRYILTRWPSSRQACFQNWNPSL